MIWIVGEYAERIDNADDLLRSFLEGFQDENTMVRIAVQPLVSVSVVYLIVALFLFQVQLQLLTAIVKLFLKKPTETQELVQQVLNLATQVGHWCTVCCSLSACRIVKWWNPGHLCVHTSQVVCGMRLLFPINGEILVMQGSWSIRTGI